MIISPERAFILIRHGQTDANRDGLIAGRTEAILTPEGRAGAARLALMDWPAQIALFASPQARAQETAALAFPGHAARTLSGLRERDWGAFEGRPVADLPPRDTTPPGGESWSAMQRRVAAAISTALIGAGPAMPVLVAHSGVIRATRALTGGSSDGPSPANTTPLLFTPCPKGWWETTLTQKDLSWTA